MSGLLSGRRAIVTGAAQGIGLAIATAYVEQGARVALVDVQGEKVARAAARLDASGERAVALTADLTDAAQVEAMVAAAGVALGPPDVLVNNAGGSDSGTGAVVIDVEDVGDALWERSLALNLTAAFRCSRAVVPAMRAGGFGRILNIASSLAWGGYGDHMRTVSARLPYVTAKAALLGLTAQLAKDLAASGICVNAIAPGFTLPEPGSVIRDRFEALTDEERHGMVRNQPMGRPGEAAEIAWMAVALAAPQASYVSGQTVLVDGASAL